MDESQPKLQGGGGWRGGVSLLTNSPRATARSQIRQRPNR